MIFGLDRATSSSGLVQFGYAFGALMLVVGTWCFARWQLRLLLGRNPGQWRQRILGSRVLVAIVFAGFALLMASPILSIARDLNARNLPAPVTSAGARLIDVYDVDDDGQADFVALRPDANTGAAAAGVPTLVALSTKKPDYTIIWLAALTAGGTLLAGLIGVFKTPDDVGSAWRSIRTAVQKWSQRVEGTGDSQVAESGEPPVE